eukprot:PITA_27693
MVFNGLRLEYALDGSSNYIAWKDHMEAVLEDNGLKDFIDQEAPKPAVANATKLAEWKKCVARVRRILLEGVRDHIVSTLHGKETLFSMWKTFKDLYQNNNDQKKLTLKDKLRKIKCEKGDTISKFPNKITTCREELGSVGITVANDDMVSLALLGLPKSWHSYQDSVNGREKLPNWERLCLDLMQEEIRRNTRDGSSSKHDDEENIALSSKAKKGKGKASHPNSSSSHGGKKIDKSKVRCFNCHEVGHYATNCPLKKLKKGPWKGSDGEALASQFEFDFTLIACMVSLMMGCGWFLDSGASFHMTGDKILFNTLEEKDLKMRIEMGNDEKHNVSRVGTVAFQREHGAHITLKNVKYVPGLKKNLVLIVMLEDKGYDVIVTVGSTMQHDERRCSADEVLGDRTSSSTNAAAGINVIDAVKDQDDRG